MAPRPSPQPLHQKTACSDAQGKVVFRDKVGMTDATFAVIDEANRIRWVYERERVKEKEKEERAYCNFGGSRCSKS